MIIKKLKNAFFTGLVVLLPLGLSVYIMYSGFIFFDNILNEAIHHLLYKWLSIEFFKDHTIPGIGLVALITVTVLTGILTRSIIVGKLLKWGNGILNRIPLFNKIYKALSQISDALFSGKKEVFKRPVLIEYPRKDIYSIAFITQDTRGPVQESLHQDVVSVFLPTTPNPTSGYLLYVPKEAIIDVSLTVEEALKVVISGGAVSPESQPDEVKPKDK